MKEGEYFGEISLLYNCKRSATVQVADYGMYGAITWRVFDELIASEPKFKEMLSKRTCDYDDTLRVFLM